MINMQQRQLAGSEIFVTSVVVSFNRRTTLERVLSAVVSQTRTPDAVLVVDNGSTDGSREYLRDLVSGHPRISLIETGTNRGGAGGFALGTAVALIEGADALWLMDDDAIPYPDCLEHLVKALTEAPDIPFAAPTVVDTDGDLHTRNRPFLDHRIPFAVAAAAAGQLSIAAGSFVGPLIRAESARQTHLPLDDFFIWHDDTEYTARLAGSTPGRQLPLACITHLAGQAGPASFVAERSIRNVRNLVWCARESRLSARSTASALSTRQWVDLLRGIVTGQLRNGPRRSRPAILRAAVTGLREGFRSRPRHRFPDALLREDDFIRR